LAEKRGYKLDDHGLYPVIADGYGGKVSSLFQKFIGCVILLSLSAWTKLATHVRSPGFTSDPLEDFGGLSLSSWGVMPLAYYWNQYKIKVLDDD